MTFSQVPYSDEPTRDNAFGVWGSCLVDLVLGPGTSTRSKLASIEAAQGHFWATWDDGGDKAISVWFKPDGALIGVKWTRGFEKLVEQVSLRTQEDRDALWAWLVEGQTPTPQEPQELSEQEKERIRDQVLLDILLGQA